MKRSSVGLIDQGLWALTNFATVALAAHTLNATSFGVFGLGYSVIVVASGLGVSMGAEAFAVVRGQILRLPIAERPAEDDELGRALAVICLFAMVAVLVMIFIVGLLNTNQGMRKTTVLIIVATPCVVMAEGARALMYANRRIPAAVSLTLIWILAQSSAFLVIFFIDGIGPLAALGSWACGALVCGVAGLIRLRVRPKLSGHTIASWKRRSAFGFEYVATAAPAQLLAALAVPFAGLDAAGSIRSMQTLYGPLNIIILGLRNTFVPVITEETDIVRIRRSGYQVAGLASMVTVAVSCLLLLVPKIGQVFMGAAHGQPNLRSLVDMGYRA